MDTLIQETSIPLPVEIEDAICETDAVRDEPVGRRVMTLAASPRIAVYYHCFLVNDWERLVDEQLSRLRDCGLYDAAQRLVIGAIGESDAVERLVARFADGDKVVFLCGTDRDGMQEGKTLLQLHEDACGEGDGGENARAGDGGEDLFWYFHSKGVSHVGSPWREQMGDWRRLMEHYLLDRWPDAVAALSSGCDLYGVNWQGTVGSDQIAVDSGMIAGNLPASRQPGHFSGNFFAARRGYLRRLPAPAMDARWGRLSNEFWVGQGARRVWCAHRSGVNHYEQSYPEVLHRR